MKELTAEQMREFWELVGFRFVTVRARTFEIVRGRKRSYETSEQRWLQPNCEFENKLYPSYHSVPFVDWELPPLDLNSLFKYAVPKLTDAQKARLPGHFSKQGSVFTMLAFEEDPALALFWAIYKILGGKE